ncbi:hypothetical protein C5O22_01650 [Treponema sp. J25]|nr:hypothetical protein C5O22_01650 [Treponema sp. J25]
MRAAGPWAFAALLAGGYLHPLGIGGLLKDAALPQPFNEGRPRPGIWAFGTLFGSLRPLKSGRSFKKYLRA